MFLSLQCRVLLVVLFSWLLQTVAFASPKYHVYLTFDDGPVHGSRQVSMILKEQQVKATAFIVGSNLRFPDLERELTAYTQNTYVELANHSFSHANGRYELFYSKPEAVAQDMEHNQKTFQFSSTISRLPGRNIWRLPKIRWTDLPKSSEAADVTQTRGFLIFGWDLEWFRFHPTIVTQSSQMLASHIKSALERRATMLPDHLVLLCHDRMFQSVSEATELRNLIVEMKATGLYEFNRLDEYPLDIRPTKEPPPVTARDLANAKKQYVRTTPATPNLQTPKQRPRKQPTWH